MNLKSFNANLVVIFLGMISMVLSIGIVWLRFNNLEVDAALYATLSSGIVGIASLLSNPNQSHRESNSRVTDNYSIGESIVEASKESPINTNLVSDQTSNSELSDIPVNNQEVK